MASPCQTSSEELDSMLERSGCKKEYDALETCLAENDRDWRMCRDVVKTWKRCDLRLKKLKATQKVLRRDLKRQN